MSVNRMNLEGGARSSGRSANLRDITLMNDVLFSLVMKDPKVAAPLISAILQQPDIEIQSIQTQSGEQVGTLDKDNAVRFDVLCRATNRLIVVEMQTYRQANLLQRARFYSSVVDATQQSSVSRRRYSLLESYVIFLCNASAFPVKGAASAFLYGETVYRDGNYVNYPTLQDGRHIIFVDLDFLVKNGYYYDSPLYDFAKFCSRYYDEIVCDTEYSEYLSRSIGVKFNSSSEVSLMLSEEDRRRIAQESREEGREEGREEERHDVIQNLYACGVDVETIARATKKSVDYVKQCLGI